MFVSLKRKFTFWIIITGVILTSFTIFFIMQREKALLEEHLVESVLKDAEVISTLSLYSLKSGKKVDFARLENVALKIIENTNVLCVITNDETGYPVSAISRVPLTEIPKEFQPLNKHKNVTFKPKKESIWLKYQLTDPTTGKTYGNVIIGFSKKPVQEFTQRIRTSMIYVLIIAIVIGSVLATFLAGRVTKPLRELMRGVDRIIIEGDLTTPVVVHSHDELGELAEKFNILAKDLRTLIEEHANELRMRRELELAQKIQQKLIPGEAPRLPGVKIAGIYLPAGIVSGDYYDFIRIDAHKIGFVIGDVAGKGIAASLLMSELRGMLHIIAPRERSPKRAISILNPPIYNYSPVEMFITLIYGILNCQTYELKYVSCGHNAPILWQDRYKNALVLPAGGIALGVVDGGEFTDRIKEYEIRLYPKDRILFYTDGVVDTRDTQSMHGIDWLREVISDESIDSPEKLIETIVNTATLSGNRELHDDIALIAMYVGELEE